MDHFRTIYRTRADDYDTLVAREDFQGNLPQALAKIRPWAGLDVVELGAGTGRLTRLLAPAAASVAPPSAASASSGASAPSLAADQLADIIRQALSAALRR